MNINFSSNAVSFGKIGLFRKKDDKKAKKQEAHPDDFIRKESSIDKLKEKIIFFEEAKDWHRQYLKKLPKDERMNSCHYNCIVNIDEAVETCKKRIAELEEIQTKKEASKKINSKTSEEINSAEMDTMKVLSSKAGCSPNIQD